MCGGTFFDVWTSAVENGLSPRVRGNQWQPDNDNDPARSIPACAGEPPGQLTGAFLVRVYPRVCGGTLHSVPRCPGRRGLSPRVRGNRRQTSGPSRQPWSIPACAGEPPPGRRGHRAVPVYPRVCGGTGLRLRAQATQKGLSPRVRGNLAVEDEVVGVAGSIPACAGEPLELTDIRVTDGVYPRVCGGTNIKIVPVGYGLGLSPRVRGNQYKDRAGRLWTRSIPACAGEPCLMASSLPGAKVYPRVCGGTIEIRTWRVVRAGLSPRVRGNPLVDHHPTPRVRSIPACAGEPPLSSHSHLMIMVYPRVCGGTARSRSPQPSWAGLSPRVRGNRLDVPA